MNLSANYLDTFETAREVRDAILLRMTILRNKYNMPEKVENGLDKEIDQLKHYLKDRFNEEFD
jgi:hypothetical protein